MEKKEFQFPPISGRGDLPANIYLHTIPYTEIQRRREKGYKLVIPFGKYSYEDHLSLGIEGIFLSRLAEYVSEEADIVVSLPIYSEEVLFQKEKEFVQFGMDILLIEEKSSYFHDSSLYKSLSVEDAFKKIYGKNSYDEFRLFFYLLLVPEMTHIEYMKQRDKIDFSLYNEAQDLFARIIRHFIDILK